METLVELKYMWIGFPVPNIAFKYSLLTMIPLCLATCIINSLCGPFFNYACIMTSTKPSTITSHLFSSLYILDFFRMALFYFIFLAD